MKEPIIIRSGRLVRPSDMTHDEWGAALARHRRARRWTRARGLVDEIYELSRALLGDVDEIDDRRIDGMLYLARAVRQAGERSRFAGTPEVQEPLKRLRARLQGYARRVQEDPIARYARLHALHDPIVDAANRVIWLGDMPGEDHLWALTDTQNVLMSARHVARLATERWADFPMSNDLRDAMSRLEAEIEELESKR